MRNLLQVMSAVLLIVVSPWAQAVRMHSIYQDQIPVATQSSKDKLEAEKAALTNVFIKVSGNAHVLDNNPNLKANLIHADSFVQEYSYTSPHNAPKATPYLLSVRFDATAVNHLLQEAGTPVWGQSRPLILVWLAMQSPGHPTDIVDSSTEIPALLRSSAKQRGVPMIFPMMDVTDLSLVSVNDITAKSITNLQQASARYASNAILVGDVTQTKSNFTSHWQLVLGQDHWNWDITGKSMQEVFVSVVDDVTDKLAARYGMLLTNAVQGELTLTVTGVKQHEDLLQLMKYLQHLNPVSDVQLKNVSNNEIVLDVSLRGSRESFMQAVALSKNLQPTSSANLADGALEYNWTQ